MEPLTIAGLILGAGWGLMLVIDFEAWWRFTAIIAMSSIAIIWRSLSHDSNDHFTMIGPKHDDSNQSDN